MESSWKQGASHHAQIDGFDFVAVRYDNPDTHETGWHIHVDLHLPTSHEYLVLGQGFHSVTFSSVPIAGPNWVGLGETLQVDQRERTAALKAIEQWKQSAQV
jgi:hypothetical protein